MPERWRTEHQTQRVMHWMYVFLRMTCITTWMSSFCMFLWLLTQTDSKVPRPLAATIHRSEPNQVLHFDKLLLGKSSSGEKYALMLNGDFSGYFWIAPYDNAACEHVASTLSKQGFMFTPPRWIPDPGRYFVKCSLRGLAWVYHIAKNRPHTHYGTIGRSTVLTVTFYPHWGKWSQSSNYLNTIGPQFWPRCSQMLMNHSKDDIKK